MLSLRHGPVSRDFACEGRHIYGGSLQRIAFLKDCELSATPVTSGYRSALIYGLSLRSESPKPVECFLPTWPSAVMRLQTLVRLWLAILAGADAPDEPRRILVSLQCGGAPGVPFADSLTDGDRSLCELFRLVSQGCPELGCYLAVVRVTHHCTGRKQNAFTPRDAWHAYDWRVDRADWALGDRVDLRNGKSLGMFGTERFAAAQGRQPESTSLIPSAGFMLQRIRDVVTPQEYNVVAACGTREFRGAALVLCPRHDAWQELAGDVGVVAAFDRLLAEMHAEPVEPPSAVSAAAAAVDSLWFSKDAKRARVAPMVGQTECAVLRSALISRGPVAVAASLFSVFRTQHRSHEDPASAPRLPPALLQVLANAPSKFASDVAPLLHRVFSEFSADVVLGSPNLLAAAIAAVADDAGPIEALCEGLKLARLRMTAPLFSCALSQARELLESTHRLSSQPVEVAAGQKRRRSDDSAEESLATAAARDAWLFGFGQSVLFAISCSFVEVKGFSSSEFRELVRLMLAHGRAADVEYFLRVKLHVFVSQHECLESLFEPHAPAIARAIESALLHGIPHLARRSEGGAELLALAWQICRLCAPAPRFSTLEIDEALSCQDAPDAAARCDVFARLLPSEPLEKSDISLVGLPPVSALGYRVVSTPTIIPDELARRVLRSISDSWPASIAQPSREQTVVYLALLLRLPGRAVAATFIAARLGQIVMSPSGSRVLASALFSVAGKSPPLDTLWDAIATGFASLSEPKAWHAFSNAVEAEATGAAALLSSLATELVERAPRASTRSDMRPQIHRVCSALVVGWPTLDLARKASAEATHDVLCTFIRLGAVDAALAFLPREPPSLLLGDLIEQSVLESSDAPQFFATSAIASLGWAPFGVALGGAVAVALQSVPSVQVSDSHMLDLPADSMTLALLFRVLAGPAARCPQTQKQFCVPCCAGYQASLLAHLGLALPRSQRKGSPLSLTFFTVFAT